jgi:hypothetical protein
MDSITHVHEGSHKFYGYQAGQCKIFFVIFLRPFYLLYYRRASSTDNIMPTTAFKTSSEADFFCGLVEVLTPVVLPTILSEFHS